jgi:hypothetical protein
MAETQAGALPLFYRDLHPVDARRHAGKSLKGQIGFGFARGTNVVMLNGAEFEAAARHFPIVFLGAPVPAALAVLGLRTGENLFVDKAGNWRAGTYVPAYVRRYPFIFHRSEDGQQFTLCLDEAADALESGAGRALFVDGQPGEAVKHALAFCAAFQRDNDDTRAFVEALAAAGLLVRNKLDVRLPSGEHLSLSGFEVIDRARFDALPDATITAWRRRGWLGFVYAHFFSLTSWPVLIDLVGAPAA